MRLILHVEIYSIVGGGMAFMNGIGFDMHASCAVNYARRIRLAVMSERGMIHRPRSIAFEFDRRRRRRR